MLCALPFLSIALVVVLDPFKGFPLSQPSQLTFRRTKTEELEWGKHSMNMDNAKEKSLPCGQSVTFRQFFRFVLKSLHHRNNHVIPMTETCDPCHEPYDVIGNMETFSDDLNYMMSLLGVRFQPDVHLSRETKLDAIFDSIQGPFGWKKKIKACVSTQEMGRRIWRKLQVRGLISSKTQYPLGEKDLTNMTKEQFYAIAVKAHYNSTDKHELIQQKKTAFAEAFRTVPLRDLEDFVKIYSDDFEAFGYEKFPGDVFKRGEMFNRTDSFDFNKAWVINSGR
ncbi:hypothetical protein ACOMHN_006740 [Nucella lapillus]